MDGNDIRAWRRDRRITQERLAEMLGVHAITVANWERGRYTIPSGMLALALEALDARLSREADATHSAAAG